MRERGIGPNMEKQRGNMERKRGNMERKRGNMERQRGIMEIQRDNMERQRGNMEGQRTVRRVNIKNDIYQNAAVIFSTRLLSLVSSK